MALTTHGLHIEVFGASGSGEPSAAAVAPASAAPGAAPRGPLFPGRALGVAGADDAGPEGSAERIVMPLRGTRPHENPSRRDDRTQARRFDRTQAGATTEPKPA